MTQRSLLQTQILEKLGAPLLAAACEIIARQNGGGDQARKQEAEMVAEMMGKAVQVSVGLSGNMDMKDAAGQGDSIRLALAAMAGQLLAGQCRITGKIPAETDIKRMIKALEAVLAFSDNFTAAPDNAARLETIAADSLILDENQAQIQYMMAFVPVINAVTGFSFGRPENKLSQEIADRIARRAALIQQALGGARADKKTAMALLPGLCRLYAECHREETVKLMGLDAAARAKLAETSGGLLPMEPVWRSFETKAAMLEALVGLKPQTDAGAASIPASAVEPRAAAPQTPAQTPPGGSPFSSFVAAPAENPPPPATEPAPAEASYSPMGFFKAKPKTQDESAGGQGDS